TISQAADTRTSRRAGQPSMPRSRSAGNAGGVTVSAWTWTEHHGGGGLRASEDVAAGEVRVGGGELCRGQRRARHDTRREAGRELLDAVDDRGGGVTGVPARHLRVGMERVPYPTLDAGACGFLAKDASPTDLS